MRLNDVATTLMAYLDSVEIAADYKITDGLLTIVTDDGLFNLKSNGCGCKMIRQVKSAYPQKSPD